MLQNSNLTIGTAVANQSGAMEADTISKNGRSSKSHTSRRNFLKMSVLLCIMLCFSAGAWGQETMSWESVKKGANNGNKVAQYLVGLVYKSGSDVLILNTYKLDTKVEVNKEQAVHWFRKSAEQGLMDAQIQLGNCYKDGYGVSIDLIQAVNWYRKAAEQGSAEAQSSVGYYYEHINKDLAQAFYWYRKAAEQGLSRAQWSLGYYYEYGEGVEKDGNTALYWYEQAIKNTKGGLDYILKTYAEAHIKNLKEEGYSSSRAKIGDSTASTPQTQTTLYLSISTSSVNFPASGGTREITVNTNDNDYSCSKVSDWCDLTQNGKTIRLACNANNGNARSDYFLVWYGERGADGKRTQSVRVNVTQDAGVKKPSATVDNVWIVHNMHETPNNMYSRMGMQIHIKFSVQGMLNKQGICGAYFFFSNGTPLKDYNGQYRTSDGRVYAGANFQAQYESAVFNDFMLFMPYEELHLQRGVNNMVFKLELYDTIISEASMIGESENNYAFQVNW